MDRDPDTLHDLVPVVHDVAHAIRTTPFDRVLSRPAAIFGKDKVNNARSQLGASLSDAARSARLAQLGRIVREPDAVRLVFSEETVRRLQSGELTIPLDKVTGLRRAEA